MRGFETVLARYGRTVELCRKAGEPGSVTRAFLQALGREESRESIPTALGCVREARYLYLGDPEHAPLGLEAGGILCDGVLYEVRTARLVYLGHRPSHWRAILTVKEDLSCSS